MNRIEVVWEEGPDIRYRILEGGQGGYDLIVLPGSREFAKVWMDGTTLIIPWNRLIRIEMYQEKKE